MSSQKSAFLLIRAIPLWAGLWLLISAPAAAYHLPKWELGLGAGVLHMPAYRGALGRENTWLPVPYVAYRGERFKADEEGLRSTLVERERFVLDFSLAGNLPVSASDGVREGMADLDPIGEIGPSLDIALGQHGERHLGWEQQWWLRLPLRAALSVGDPWVAHRGWVFSPYLNWVWVRVGEAARWRWNLSAGPIFASRANHDYFYSVGAADVTATRPAYASTAGYSGQRISLALAVNTKKWFVGGFVRYDDLRGATFEDSPLVETRGYLVLGVAVSRIFLQSGGYAPH
ncbi:MAG: MipA/OmpV family protein [Gammaproteobacteria bacterium]|nr:MipA/OmpV family protein [Gammaproteobacteria bacterium]